MISRSTGEVVFEDLRLVPQAVLRPGDAPATRALPVQGWSHHLFGVRQSDRGGFSVEALSDQEGRIQVVLLAHAHPFYQADTPDDSERHVFHEGVIAADLAGQREFSWGQVFCRLDRKSNRDWLVVAYAQGPQVPLQTATVLRHLHEHAPEPGET